MWNILEGNKIIKQYPHYEQCVIWCYLKGYVTYCRGKDYLSTNVRITNKERGK